MKKCRSSRPYLKCRLKFDWHIKSHEMSSHFLGALVEFLIEKGFKRPRKTKRNREGQSVVSFGNCSTEKAKDRNISKEGNVDKEDSEATRKVAVGFFI